MNTRYLQYNYNKWVIYGLRKNEKQLPCGDLKKCGAGAGSTMQKQRQSALMCVAFVAMLTMLTLLAAPGRAQTGDAGANAAIGVRTASSPDAVEASIHDRWRRAAEFPGLSNLAINWRMEDHFLPEPGDMDALRKEVKADASSGRAPELAEYERRMRDGTPLVRTFSLRARDAGSWRLCHNMGAADGEADFIDYVLDDGLAWKLTPTWLVLIDATKPMPTGHPIPSVGSQFMHDAVMFLDGGLRNAVLNGAEMQSVTRSDSEWRLACLTPTRTGKVQQEFHWSWDDVAARARIDRLVIKSGEHTGWRWELSGWKIWRPDAARAEDELWAASRAEKYNASGKLTCVLTLEKITRETPGRYDEVVTPAFFDTPDALRGLLTFRSITDYREDPPVEIIKTSEGIQRFPLALAEKVAAEGEDDYRRIGWGLAGLTALSVVFVRLCRGRGTGTSSTPCKMEKAV
jgi:hypothetical protein